MESFVDVRLKYIGLHPWKVYITETLGQCSMFAWWDVLVIASVWSGHKGQSPWLPLFKAACVMWEFGLHVHLSENYATSADTAGRN